MLRLHVDQPLMAEGAELALPPGPARHAQVRRVQPGDELRLFDGRGGEWRAEVTSMTRHDVHVRLLAHEAIERELPLAVTLAVGMPANERMDWLVEKATELGVAVLQPLLCERSVLRLDGERAQRKCEHWQAQAVAAAEQSGRTRVPVVRPVQRLGDWLRSSERPAVGWLLSPAAHKGPPAPPMAGQALALLSGPEGGLSADEEKQAREAGLLPVALGPRVLRAETAPLAVLAWLTLS